MKVVHFEHSELKFALHKCTLTDALVITFHCHIKVNVFVILLMIFERIKFQFFFHRSSSETALESMNTLLKQS